MAPTAPSFPAIGFSSAEMNTREIYTRGLIASFLSVGSCLSLVKPLYLNLKLSQTKVSHGFAHFEQRKTTEYLSTKYHCSTDQLTN